MEKSESEVEKQEQEVSERETRVERREVEVKEWYQRKLSEIDERVLVDVPPPSPITASAASSSNPASAKSKWLPSPMPVDCVRLSLFLYWPYYWVKRGRQGFCYLVMEPPILLPHRQLPPLRFRLRLRQLQLQLPLLPRIFLASHFGLSNVTFSLTACWELRLVVRFGGYWNM
jgi:hypothetical protein